VGQLQKAKETGGEEPGRGFEIEKVREAIEREKEQLREEARRIDEERQRVKQTKAEHLATDHLRASTQRDAEGQGSMGAVRPGARLLQVHNSFLVTQDEQGVVIIDQHALHERVMFETLKQRIEKGNLESQNLLVPDVIDAAPRQIEILDDLGALLGRLGISAEASGPTTVAVHGFPSLLFERGVEPGVFVGELLARVESEGLGGSRKATDAVSSEAALHEVLDMMACKAAVKAGDRLSDDEIARLIEMRDEVERSSNCPHGRPTSIRLTIKELEKQFGR
jgi:DNA mismatch repair protein MutL